MSNSILTIDMITRKALEILENNLVLTRNVNRQYDDSFAVEGAKIGSTLRIRLPDRALVTDGAALQVQDDNEQFTTLTVANQKHIGVNFTTAELTMQLMISQSAFSSHVSRSLLPASTLTLQMRF
jgi:predicted pyridoxine 5'-phosphate oxidase superfamily flavin-nucleotide-binding protein